MRNISVFVVLLILLGFDEYLRAVTTGKYSANYIFSHWKDLEGDPLEDGSEANKVVREVRIRKGLGEDVAFLNTYLDTM